MNQSRIETISEPEYQLDLHILSIVLRNFVLSISTYVLLWYSKIYFLLQITIKNVILNCYTL